MSSECSCCGEEDVITLHKFSLCDYILYISSFCLFCNISDLLGEGLVYITLLLVIKEVKDLRTSIAYIYYLHNISRYIRLSGLQLAAFIDVSCKCC